MTVDMDMDDECRIRDKKNSIDEQSKKTDRPKMKFFLRFKEEVIR